MTVRTIGVVTLPPASRDLIMEGQLAEALDPNLFSEEGEHEAMKEVSEFVALLTGFQPDMLLTGLQHSLDEVHRANVHFLEFKSGYDIEGIGLELKDDSVTEEKLTGPLRVMFVTWNAS